MERYTPLNLDAYEVIEKDFREFDIEKTNHDRRENVNNSSNYNFNNSMLIIPNKQRIKNLISFNAHCKFGLGYGRSKSLNKTFKIVDNASINLHPMDNYH